MAAPAPAPKPEFDALNWAAVKESRAFELRSGGQVVGSLRWRSRLGSLADAEFGDLRFTLKRSGFLAPRVTAQRDPGGAELGRLDVHGSHSTLRLVGDSSYTLRRAGLLVPAWKLTSSSGGPVLDLEPVQEHGRLEGGLVTVEPGYRASADLLVLLGLTWHFIVLAWFEEVVVLAGDSVLRAASDQ